MVPSWTNFVSRCKSRLSAIARSCFLGRVHWRQKYQEVNQLLEEALEKGAESEALREQLEQENIQLRHRMAELENQLAQPQSINLPVGEPPTGQQYGAGLITLCVNLASKIGLRPAAHALKIVFDWLRVSVRIPTYQSIRNWMQRIGLDRMQNAEKTADGVWLTDHTNQIGKEKVLTILRVRESNLLHRGVPLRHRDVEVVALVPGESWKREDVSKVYQETAGRCGTPRVVESDGAVELREPVENLGKPAEKPLVIPDLKHFLANKFEALLNKDPQYQAFNKQIAGTRSALQQTELAHFIPPSLKMKARFMNLEPTLSWASTVLWHLDHPESRSRQGITEDRMREKLGWLSDFAPSIGEWQTCQEVISAALKLINKQGIFRGVSKQLEKLLAGLSHSPMSQQLVDTVVGFLKENEAKLRRGERVPMSTEILESSFSLYKQLEKQHSKSGFTSLLLTFPTLLRNTTSKEVTASLGRVKMADVKQWAAENLPCTLASKRQLVFREPRTKTKKKTNKSATSVGVAA